MQLFARLAVVLLVLTVPAASASAGLGPPQVAAPDGSAVEAVPVGAPFRVRVPFANLGDTTLRVEILGQVEDRRGVVREFRAGPLPVSADTSVTFDVPVDGVERAGRHQVVARAEFGDGEALAQTTTFLAEDSTAPARTVAAAVASGAALLLAVRFARGRA